MFERCTCTVPRFTGKVESIVIHQPASRQRAHTLVKGRQMAHTLGQADVQASRVKDCVDHNVFPRHRFADPYLDVKCKTASRDLDFHHG